MCEAKHYTEQILDIYNNINQKVIYYKNELSQVDLYEQDILHMLENEKFNAAEGYKLAKMLSDNRQKRRQIKNELEPLQQLKNNFIDHNMQLLNQTYQEVKRKDIILNKLQEDKKYNPRVLPTTSIKQVTNKISIKTAIYRKTGEKVTILRQDSDDLYYCLRQDGNKNFLKLKDLIIENNNINI